MTHTVQAVAWTLIHFCWQGAAIAALFFAASKLLSHRSSNARYVTALVALLLMLTASAATFSWEMRSSPASFSFGPAAAPAASAGDDHAGYKFSPTVTPVSDTPRGLADAVSITDWLPWIDAFWLVGVVVLTCRSLGGWWLIQRLRAAAADEAPAAVIASFQRIAAALGIQRPVMLRVSRTIAGPLAVGVLRALVLLPLSAVTSLSEEELQVVLAHELAHIRRADFFWNLVQTFIETLLFFHPAVWWIGGRLRHERELCCDDLALTVCPDRLVYARALYRLEEQRRSNWQFAMALDGHQPAQTLRMRIARILGEPLAGAAGRGPFSVAAAGALLVVLMLPVPQVMASLDPVAHLAQAVPASVDVLAPPLSHILAPPAASPAPRSAEPAPAGGAAQTRQNAAESSQQNENESTTTTQQQSTATSTRHRDYIDEMKAAGYDVDLDKLVAMKIQGVTAEYAQQMSQLGFGKLTADQLIACRIQDVSADYIAKMKAAGYDADIGKYISMRIQDVTPEYAEKMAQLGFGKLGADDLISARIQDVTPEYIAQLKRDGLEVKSIHDAISYRIFNVTPEFIAGMKAAGFDNLDHKQLMALRVQGVTPEYARSIRQQYPGATIDDIVKTKIFNINADFIADAKRHGFTDLTLDKLVKLRISGILDDDSDSK
ncbi:MAG TPA: M56 family metallopeptidase [Terracidiphilus sp.]|nr:M56 family metallopeptidase [Terracidiphilus sp.]